MSLRKVTIAGGIGVLLLLTVGVAAAALGVSFSEVQAVSFGESTNTQSDLTVTGTDTEGPGINVDEFVLTVDNAGNDPVTATVEVWLLSGDTEVATGTLTETFNKGETDVNVELDDRVRESDYGTVDIRLTEN
jgi:hypothetical protein